MQVQQTPAVAAEVAQQVMWLGIRLEGWLIIAAVILGPILALWAQRWSERRREERTRKLWLFRELMATRTIRLSGRHVEALNHIDLEFDPKKKADAKVLDAWKMYLDTLSDTPKEDAQKAARYEKREERFVDLIWEIAQHLGFSFDKAQQQWHACTTELAEAVGGQGLVSRPHGSVRATRKPTILL